MKERRSRYIFYYDFHAMEKELLLIEKNVE